MQLISRMWKINVNFGNYVLLTYYAEMSHPGFGLCSIDLTHVSSRIRSLYVANMQIPGVTSLMWHSNPRISRDNLFVNCQNGRPIQMDPGHFMLIQIFYSARQNDISTLRYSDIL